MIVEQSREIIEEVNKAFIGKNNIIEKVLMTIYAGGHVLLEDCPGVGKTTLALAFAKVLGLSNKRISLPQIRCRQISQALICTTEKRISLNTEKELQTASFFLLMRLTELLQRLRRHFLRLWKSIRSALMV